MVTEQQPPSHSAETLRRQIQAELANPKGISEERVEQLRSTWESYQAEGGGDGGDATMQDATPDETRDETLDDLWQRLEEMLRTQNQERAKHIAEVEEKIASLEANLRQGATSQSQQLERDIRSQVKRIIGLSEEARHQLLAKLEEFRPQLQELTPPSKSDPDSDTQRMRENLIQEISTIHQHQSDLVKVASRIKAARKQWQKIDLKEGASNLYKQFDKACNTAWKPCEQYFLEQYQVRQKNTAVREKICATLEQEFENIDWREPQWKDIRRLVQNSITKWRKSGPADYKKRKPLQLRFQTVVEKFEDRLDREQQRNFRMREKITDDVAALRDKADMSVRAKMYALKSLQREWVVSVGSAKKAEEELWKRYTQLCAQIYASQKESLKEYKATLNDNLSARKQFCQTIEKACEGDPQYQTIQTELPKWQTAWEQMGEVQRGDKKQINARFRDAIKKAKTLCKLAHQNAATQTTELLRQKSELCAALEAAALKGSAATDKLNARWAKLAALPEALETLIQARWQIAQKAVGDSKTRANLQSATEDNFAALNEMLLHLEILSGLDSPPEHSTARMKLQVGRLSAAMGKGNGAAKDAETLLRDALLVGAVNPKTYKSALARWDACAKALADAAADAGSESSPPSSTSRRTRSG